MVDVGGADAAAVDQLVRLRQRAAHEVAPSATANLRVVGSAAEGYEVFDGPDRLARVPTARAVLDEVFARAHRRAFELASLKGWVRFHGAVLSIGASRVAIVGPSGAGKTTLALALLQGGAAFETDESFVARDGSVFSVARRLHVKPGTADHVPTATWIQDAPVLDGDPPLRVIDPTEHGLPWDVALGPIDHLVVLERRAGPSSIGAVAASTVVQGLIAESFPVTESRAAVVRQAAALVRGRPLHRVVNGSDGRAAALVASLATA
ncbi:hypothetical protein BH10ACT1_BH10ACT1_33950 [soil metagenome]